MGAYSIPLMVKPPNIETPMESMAAAYNVLDMIQKRKAQQLLMQERQIDIQNKQRAMDAQKTLGDLLAQNTTVGQDGALSVNHGAILQGLAVKGYGEQALKYDAQRRADLKSAFEQQEAQYKMNSQKAARWGQLAGSITMADPGNRPRAYATALQQAAQEGIIAPQQAQQLIQAGYSPELDGQLEAFKNQALTASQQSQQMVAKTREAREKLLAESQIEARKATTAEAQARLPGLKAKAEQDQMELLAQKAQGVSDQNGWDEFRLGLPAEQRAKVPPVYSKDAVEKLGRTGMTPSQAATRDQAAANAVLAKQRLDLQRQRLEMEKVENARSQSADRRQAYSQIKTLEDQEDAVNMDRKRLGEALAKGNIYLSPKGGPAVPIDVAAKEATNSRNEKDLAGVRKSLLDDMKARYDQTGPRLARIVEDKYNQYGRLGVKPGVPLEQVQKAILSGDQTTSTAITQRETPPGTAPATAPQKPAAPAPSASPATAAPHKSYTEADIRTWAKQTGRDPEQAVQAARQKKLIP